MLHESTASDLKLNIHPVDTYYANAKISDILLSIANIARRLQHKRPVNFDMLNNFEVN